MEQQTPTEQGPAPSVEDRIANIFGGPSPEQPNEPETASEQPESTDQSAAAPVEETFELDYEGEKFQLPKKLEKAVMQERDYTQKSQQLAEQRKTYELLHEQARISRMQEAFQQEIAPESKQLQMYDAVLEQARSIDWSSMTTDEVIRKKMELDSWKEQRQAIAQQIEGKQREFIQKQQGELQKFQQQALDTITKRIPGWGKELQSAIRESAIKDGYTEAELGSIVDPRHVLTLWKAHQFDQLQAKAQPSVQAAKTVKTSPTNPMPQQTRDFLNFKKAVAKTSPNSSERRQLVEQRVGALFAKR